MKPEFKEAYRKTLEVSMEIQALLVKLDELLSSGMSVEELADADYALHRTLEVAEDLRSRIRRVSENATSITVLRWLTTSDDGEPIRTDYVTASPKMTSMPKVPSMKNDPENYSLMCESMGIPESVYKLDTFRPHWPSMLEHVAMLQAEGKPLPKGLNPGESYPRYNIIRRKKKEVLED